MPRGIPNSSSKEVHSVDFMADADAGPQAIDYEVLRTGARQIETVTEREFESVKEMEAFMNERVTIVVHKTADKNESPRVPVGLNGEIVWLPRDIPVRIPRRLVGVLAQSQEASFSTDDNPNPNADEGKIITRRKAMATQFSVMHDPNPLGAAWLRRAIREG